MPHFSTFRIDKMDVNISIVMRKYGLVFGRKKAYYIAFHIVSYVFSLSLMGILGRFNNSSVWEVLNMIINFRKGLSEQNLHKQKAHTGF